MSWMNDANLTQAVAEIKAFCQGAFAALTHKHTTLGDANATVLTVDPTNKSVVAGTVAVSPYDDPGANSFTEGIGCTASGAASHAEGESSWASQDYAHAEGHHTAASGYYSHSEGDMTTASGTASHAEGYSSDATGSYSHAEGYNATASGYGSHAEGTSCTASEHSAHAEGIRTTASSMYQHVQGKYNIPDAQGTYAHIVGGGSGETPKDIQTLDWNGNLAQGTVNHASCYTESNTAAKAATTGAGFCLVSGVRVSVKFMYAQTAAAAITLNVNSTGAKTVYVGGSATSSSNPCTWPADAICEFVYVNNAWYYLGNNIDGAAGLASLRDSVSLKAPSLYKASLGMYQEGETRFFTVSWDISATEYYTLQIGVGGGVYDASFFHFYPGGYEKLIGFSLT